MTETKKNPIGRFIENTLVPISTAFAQNRYVRCIGTGSQNLMAIIMIGAVFNLLNSIQIDPYQSFIQATGIAAFLNAVYNACMNFMGVFMVFSVGYAGAKIFGHDEMAFFNQFIDKGLIERLELVANSEFGRITYTDAIEVLKKNNKKFQFPVEWGVDIQTEHERYLTEVVFKKPVFVTDYPKEIKSFYMKQNADGKTVAAADMLVPGIGELIGGSQREEDYDKLVARMDELGLDKSSYDWYLNLRKFGGVEHAGYGLGFERMIMYLTGIQNIRDVLPFPRTAYGF